jgi:hypothetical protein
MFVAFAVFLAISAATAGRRHDEGAVLLSNAIKARERIRQGDVSLFSRYVSFSGRKIDGKYRTWFSDDQFRLDIVDAAKHRITCYPCYEGAFVEVLKPFLNEMGEELPEPVVATITVLAPTSDPRSTSGHASPDPRYLGLLPESYLNSALIGVGSFFLAKGETSVNQDVVNGKRCKRVSFVNYANLKVNVWLVPEEQHSVYKVTCEGRGGRNAEIISELEYHNDVDCWYPATVRFVARSGDGRERTEAVEVTRANFDQSPERTGANVYSLNHMSIAKPGSPVFWLLKNKQPPETTGRLVWNGRAVVGATRFDVVPPVLRDEAPRYAWTLVLANIAAFCLLAAIWILWSHGKKTSQESSNARNP